MGKMQRTKGHAYEREIAKALRRIFPDAQRNITESRGGEKNGIDLENTGRLAIQCKRYAKYAPIQKIKEVPDGDHIPALVTRGDNKRTVICLYLDDFIDILEDVGTAYNE
jgi:hypothetical protein